MRKKAPSGAQAKSQSAIAAAQRSGAEIETVKKQSGGTNHHSGSAIAAHKLDQAEEADHLPTVSMELSKRIQQARMAKKDADGKAMTQAQLAQAINEKASVVNDYEQGKAIPSQQIIGKMERALGVKLRGESSK